MKNIGQWLAKKTELSGTAGPKKQWDEKSIFYAFQRVVKDEYGNQGIKNFVPDFWKNGRLFVRVESSVWASELQLNRQELRAKVNKELGGEEIREIKVK
jgi:predicted nucleic acid-binding Zn ribbon protein